MQMKNSCRNIQDRLHNGSRVKPHVVCLKAEECSDTFLVESKKMADRYGVTLNTSIAYTLQNVIDTKERTGYRPVERLYHLGVLGPNVQLVHMIHVNDREIEMLKGMQAKRHTQPFLSPKIASWCSMVWQDFEDDERRCKCRAWQRYLRLSS